MKFNANKFRTAEIHSGQIKINTYNLTWLMIEVKVLQQIQKVLAQCSYIAVYDIIGRGGGVGVGRALKSHALCVSLMHFDLISCSHKYFSCN